MIGIPVSGRILNGNQIRDEILAEVKREIAELAHPPGLAAVLVGADPASEIYVRNKLKACEAVGIGSKTLRPSAGITTEELLAIVRDLNNDDDVDGILVQLPLPPQIDAQQVLLAVDPAKDVDGFHPVNMGSLATGAPRLVPCTPAGLIEILRRSEIPIAGKHAVVIGRSNIVGKPAALLLLMENATVTICHSRTADLPAVCRQADILVAAIGRGAMVTRDYIKPGAVVLDVGMNRLTDVADVERAFSAHPAKVARFHEKGTALVGDVHPGDMEELSSAYTPVPGGVGPLTIAMLMKNTVRAAKLRRG
jgi:methylenetetrahydrofolate dehydrogenase (NADP+)/methenyltetrahydrofolate cyclohydrolase